MLFKSPQYLDDDIINVRIGRHSVQCVARCASLTQGLVVSMICEGRSVNNRASSLVLGAARVQVVGSGATTGTIANHVVEDPIVRIDVPRNRSRVIVAYRVGLKKPRETRDAHSLGCCRLRLWLHLSRIDGSGLMLTLMVIMGGFVFLFDATRRVVC